MDLTGLEDGLLTMLIWWACLLFLMSLFIDYGAFESITICAIYVFVTFKWMD